MDAMRSALSGTPRKDGRWEIAVTLTRPDGSKQKKRLYAKTQREVQAKARELLAGGRTAHPRTTVNDMIDFCEHGPWKRLGPRTLEQYVWASKRIRAEFGRKQIAALTMPEVYRWVVRLGDDPALSGRSVQIHRSVLRLVVQQAMFQGLCASNPVAGWKMPVRVKSSVPDISPADVQTAIEGETDARRRLFLRALYETGARPQEATNTGSAGLRTLEGRRWLFIPGTKTDNAPRLVPISHELADALMELPEPWFPFDRSAWTRIWHNAQTRMGWRPKRKHGGKRTAPDKKLPPLYSLRGCRITLWRDMGVSDEVWAYLAGHGDVEVTREKYDRVSVERVAAQLFGPSNRSVNEREGAAR